MKLRQLNIKNFRGIKDLTIEKLNDINVFVGNNNVGKTSILEAIFLSIGISQPRLTLNIDLFRNILHDETSDFKFIFKDLDFSKPIKIQSSFEQDIRKLSISPKYRTVGLINKHSKNGISISADIKSNGETQNEICGIDYDFEILKDRNKKDVFKSYFYLNDEGKPDYFIPKNYKENLNGRFITPFFIVFDELYKIVDNLLNKKKEKEFIKELKLFEPKINGIRTSDNRMILVDIGLNEFVPLGVLGRGFMTYLYIICTLFDDKNNKFLVLDDMENGLHYTAMKYLWNSILTLAKEKNIQLFIATQSLENIMALLAQMKQDNSEGLKLYRIEKSEDNVKVLNYTFENIRNSLDFNLELR